MVAKILVVDDEPDLQVLIGQKFRKKIRQNEYQFLFASNGLEAIEIIRIKADIEIVITDINMPVMDGLTLLTKINELESSVLKTIVLSAFGDMTNIRAAMNTGAFDFLTKPINLHDLEITIEKTLKQVQQQRHNQKLEKMSILGQSISAIAHEINNPVGFISGNLTHAEEYLKDLIEHLNLYQQSFPTPGEAIDKNADKIDLEYLLDDFPQLISSMKIGIERIRDISNSLRIFSRSDTQEKILFNLHQGINSTLTILQYRLRANENRPHIEVIKDYGELPEFMGFAGQLNQVFMNIMANAIDAFDELTEQKYNEAVKDNNYYILIQTRWVAEEDKITIKIQDNGPGMPETVRAKIFNHLFTTKSVGKGTGLGLAISRQIIEDLHQGQLMCHSEVGKGTEFIIEIPC